MIDLPSPNQLRDLLVHEILIPSLRRLYEIDYSNIKSGVSERNICARLAHHIENIMREYDNNHDSDLFAGFFADVEYNRMGDGDLKCFENRLKRPQIMVSDLLIQSRGHENLLAVEMKRKGNNKGRESDRERLESMVSPYQPGRSLSRCVHDTLLGAFIDYSPDEVLVELYEGVDGQGVKSEVLRLQYKSTSSERVLQ